LDQPEQNNMLEEIKGCFDNFFSLYLEFNDKVTRDFLIGVFKLNLEKHDPNVIVKCDEENNPPDVIDNGLLRATILWDKDKYCNIEFGTNPRFNY
jgi:hypothetical protein